MDRRTFLTAVAALAPLPAFARASADIIYIDAANCSTCRAFDKNGLAALQSIAAAHGYGMKRVNVRSFQDMREEAAWPQSLKAIRQQMKPTNGAPRFLVVYNGKIYRDILGSDDVFGYFER